MRDFDAIDLLRHVRHDWLNSLQLIKGYIAMGNMEKVNALIDDIIQNSHMESKITNINLPELSLLFITYNWESPSFILNYEVTGNGKCKSVEDEAITTWFRNFFSVLNETVSIGEDNELNITIRLNEEGSSFFIEFYGILTDIESVQTYLQNKNQFTIKNLALSEEAIVFELIPN